MWKYWARFLYLSFVLRVDTTLDIQSPFALFNFTSQRITCTAWPQGHSNKLELAPVPRNSIFFSLVYKYLHRLSDVSAHSPRPTTSPRRSVKPTYLFSSWWLVSVIRALQREVLLLVTGDKFGNTCTATSSDFIPLQANNDTDLRHSRDFTLRLAQRPRKECPQLQSVQCCRRRIRALFAARAVSSNQSANARGSSLSSSYPTVLIFYYTYRQL